MDYKMFPVVFPECPIEQVHERPLLAEAAVWAESPAKTQRSRVPMTQPPTRRRGAGLHHGPAPVPGRKPVPKVPTLPRV